MTPVEAFVLSRVDGTTSYDEIIMLCGRGETETVQILQKLRRDGVILRAGETPPAPGPRSPTPAGLRSINPARREIAGENKPAAAVRPAPPPPAEPERVSLLEKHDDGSAVDGKLLAQAPDLSAEFKLRIARLHRKLKRLQPHELLGIARDADRGAAKRAYFGASKELHPDRFYGKDIGPFRDMLTEIFTNLTRAFETLDKK
jgi:hypothetical protein